MKTTRYTSLFIIVLFACIGLIFWYSQTTSFNRSLNSEASLDSPIPRFMSFLSRPVNRPTESTNSTQRSQTPSNSGLRNPASEQKGEINREKNLDQFQEQLPVEKEKLNNLETRLQNLKTRHAQEERQVSLTYPSKALENSNQIQQLMSLLQEQQLAEDDISELAQNSFREQGQSVQAARDQIDQEIQIVQNQFSQVLQQIDYQMFLPPPGTPEQTAEYQYLFDQRSQLLQQLTILRQQKAEISANALSQTQAVNQQSQSVKEELLDNQSAIREQIYLLQNENTRLQQAQNQIRMSSRSLTDQIRETQSSLTEQQQRVQSLESQTNSNHTTR